MVLQTAARGHICKLCIHYKNCVVIWAVPLILLFHGWPAKHPTRTFANFCR